MPSPSDQRGDPAMGAKAIENSRYLPTRLFMNKAFDR
jgi:hypothetical protein